MGTADCMEWYSTRPYVNTRKFMCMVVTFGSKLGLGLGSITLCLLSRCCEILNTCIVRDAPFCSTLSRTEQPNVPVHACMHYACVVRNCQRAPSSPRKAGHTRTHIRLASFPGPSVGADLVSRLHIYMKCWRVQPRCISLLASAVSSLHDSHHEGCHRHLASILPLRAARLLPVLQDNCSSADMASETTNLSQTSPRSSMTLLHAQINNELGLFALRLAICK